MDVSSTGLPTSVALLGTGPMGAPIARNILAGERAAGPLEPHGGRRPTLLAGPGWPTPRQTLPPKWY